MLKRRLRRRATVKKRRLRYAGNCLEPIVNPVNRGASLLLTFALTVGVYAADVPRDPKADEIAKEMMKAMGGQDAWNKARFLRFDFKVVAAGKEVVNRAHLWDKQTGKYRLEDMTKQGQSRVSLLNTGDQQGTAYVAGKRIDGDDAKVAVKDAYGAFINDMYWLAMPWKWMDQGVHLKYLGKKSSGGKEYDVVQLTFDHVGLTPGDRYEAFVSPQTHMMEHWEYKLQGGGTGQWDWEYKPVGALKIVANHTSKDGKSSINMGDVRVLASVDDPFFADPARTLATLK